MGWLDKVGNFISEAAETVANAAVYAAQNPLRSMELVGQGLVQGAARGVAGLGDLAVMGVNAVAGTDYHPDLAGKAQRAVTWTEAQNENERALLSAGRGIGEVGVFVVPGVGAAGLAGLGAGALSGTARATAVKYAANTARAILPTTKTGLAVDTTVAGGLATMDYVRETENNNLAQQVLEQTLQHENEKLQSIVERQQVLIQEFKDIETTLEQGGLNAADRQALIDRREQVREGVRITVDMVQGNYTPEEEKIHMERLKEIEAPAQEQALYDPSTGAVHKIVAPEQNQSAVAESTSPPTATGDFAAMVQVSPGTAARLDADITAQLNEEPIERQVTGLKYGGLFAGA